MSHSFNRTPIVAALDIGTSKVCCVIARVTRDKRVSILGYGYNASKGIKNGVVVDVNQATIAVCNAVETAEQMANERITNVIVNVSGDRTRSVIRSSSVGIHKNGKLIKELIESILLCPSPLQTSSPMQATSGGFCFWPIQNVSFALMLSRCIPLT